jgi:tetratricopeptide (TPR) repeat protein
MTWVILVASAVLSGIAAAGVLRPFGGDREEGLERLADPLEDERAGLLRSLRDLDEERALGELSEEDYRALRTETEARAVAVLRALEAREGAGELGASLRSLRPPLSGYGRADRPAGRLRIAMAVLAAVVTAAVAVPLLVNALKSRSAGEPITGSVPSAPSSSSGMAFFEQRVADHPNDVAARLDLARRYMQAGDVQGAVAQYLTALSLDPNNAEAHSALGYLLYRAGKPDEGLKQIEEALAQDPAYPEALYYKGVVLLKGLSRPSGAAVALQAYLDAAPFGSFREEAGDLLEEARSASG